MTEINSAFADARGAFLSLEFNDVADVAECALDEQLEQLQRHYAAATRAAVKASSEVERLEGRDDTSPHVLAQAKRQRAAAETRSARLLTAIDALEDRLENE